MTKEKDMEEVYLTPKEAAFRNGVSPDTMWRWIREGLVSAEKRGKRLLFVPQSEVLKVVRERRDSEPVRARRRV